MSLYLGTTPIAVNSSSREIGEIIQSTIPLSDAGLHLLDGSVISGSGSYSAFVTYIAGLVSSYPDLFTTEANWQQSVTDYGVCGKFVYDSTNNTVRLPKITGFTEGTIDPTTLGDLTQAGLPNITGNTGYGFYNTGGQVGGSFYSLESPATGAHPHSETTESKFLALDASRSSSIYGNSSTVQPQSIKVLYYIVIATSTKTSIEVDIDEVMTDLNGKVDKADLATCHVVVETYVNGTSWYRVYDDGWCEQGGFYDCEGTTYNLKTINLLKTYKDTNYSVFIELYNEDYGSAAGEYYMCIHNKTTETFDTFFDGNIQRKMWFACGYIR